MPSFGAVWSFNYYFTSFSIVGPLDIGLSPFDHQARYAFVPDLAEVVCRVVPQHSNSRLFGAYLDC